MWVVCPAVAVFPIWAVIREYGAKIQKIIRNM